MAATPTFQENLVAAEKYLRRFAAEPLTHLIGGEAVMSASAATFVNHSPIDGSRLAEVPSGDTADVDAAAAAAAEAFPVWRATPAVERKRLLHRVADVIESRAHQIAVTECCDTGQTMRFMSSEESWGQC